MSRRACLLWLLAFIALTGCGDRPPETAALDVAAVLGETGDAGGYARALETRDFRFPRDHGPHPDFRNEWWYLTGHGRDREGRLFGYQLTFFRVALAPELPESSSAWAANQLWMVHAAVTDVAGGRHLETQRFARGALNLAGGRRHPVKIWLGDWWLEHRGGSRWSLHVDAGEFSLSLELDSLKPVVLQGDRGLSRKGPAPGNASYYYSLTRLATSGHITLNGERHAITGLSWLDREWSTSALAEDQTGWDWFSLQVEGQKELMFYRLRTTGGNMHPNSQGVWVTAQGNHRRISPGDLSLEPVEFWESPNGRRYPVAWTLHYPARAVNWRVKAVLPDQEMDLVVRYWEGLVEVIDENDRTIGHGYLELTGY